MKNDNILYLVLPSYNEEDVLLETANRLKEKMMNLMKQKLIHKKSKIMFVDDGSNDRTWSIIESLHKNDDIFVGVKLSRNQGHQNALYAGLMIAKEDSSFVISLDADLQDDINAIDEMVEEYFKGNFIVYGVRSSRKTDHFLKRNTAQFFYKFMKFCGVNIVYNHADYRLMSKEALEALSSFKEVHLFLRGIVPLLGFKSTNVYYERHERFAGKSKYSLGRMISFALDGITSFSVKPLRMITVLGGLILGISILIMIYSVFVKLFGYTVQGWTFIVVSIWFIGGLQMTSIGIIGEYIGKIYKETKERPRYIIETILK